MIKSLKGTEDILPPNSGLYLYLENIARSIFKKYDYKEIRTPTIESTSLFIRGIGKETDIVQKQMYAFKDQGGRDICLRPEQTAPVVRAYIEHNLSKTEKFAKLFYICSMYRSERPQAGRQRQFNQIGVEVLGSDSPYSDAEIILLLDNLLKAMSIKDFQFRINSLGCDKDKEKFKSALKNSLKHDVARLCEDCQRRYNTNILRILDCKNQTCKKLINTLKMKDEHLCIECSEHYKKVLFILKREKINYKIDPSLVRGLDYYTGTVFEVISQGLGAQDAIAAGGRYDNLVSELGGPATGACGFAIGFERAVSLIKQDALKYTPEIIKLFLVTMDADSREFAFKLLHNLRANDISCDMDFQNRSLKSQMRYADKINAEFVAVIGENELKSSKITLKDMKTGKGKEVGLKELASFFA